VATDLGFSKQEFSEVESLAESLWSQTKQSKGNILLLILQSFDWLAAFHLE
jgi:hypothetical protein